MLFVVAVAPQGMGWFAPKALGFLSKDTLFPSFGRLYAVLWLLWDRKH
jgi:hypothetical protein